MLESSRMDIYFINLDIYDKNDGSLKLNSRELKKLQHEISEQFSKNILNKLYKNNSEIIRQNKKPLLKDESMYLSISHSKSVVALAFDKDKIGIDIEYKKQRKYEDILKYFGISNTEKISSEEFFKIWTTYEAEYKSGIQANIFSLEYKNYICTISSKNKETPKFYETEISKDELFKYKNNTNNHKISEFLPIECKLLPQTKIKLKISKNI